MAADRIRARLARARLANLRLGTKLLLLVLLPAAFVVVIAIVAVITHQRSVDRLSGYRERVRLSFAVARVAGDLEQEGLAGSVLRIEPGAEARARLAAADDATSQAFEAAARKAARARVSPNVAQSLDAVRAQRDAVVRQIAAGSLDPSRIAADYEGVEKNLLNLVTVLGTAEAQEKNTFDLAMVLNSAEPTIASGRAAGAYGSILQAIENAAGERAFVAGLFAPGAVRPPAAESPWLILETGDLEAFRQSAPRDLIARLSSALASPYSSSVQRVEGQLATDPPAAIRAISLREWISVSGARIAALQSVAAATARHVDQLVSEELATVHGELIRDLALSLAILLLVTAIALAVQRSIVRPLREVSAGARMLAHGDVSSHLTYDGRNEIGDVAAAFRDVRATTDRLVHEIAENDRAVREDRLDHRADLGGLEGVWSQLLAGTNDTMAAFSELQGRQRRAERDVEQVFDMSLDLLFIIGFDGYLKRVNPAFERAFGRSQQELLSRPAVEFAHPDEPRTGERLARMRRGEQVEPFETRYVRTDGSTGWLQWNVRPVSEEQLIYCVARDVTESRYAAEEQAALRRVATLVARAETPSRVLEAVAEEAGKLIDADLATIGRYSKEPPAAAVVGWRRDGKPVLQGAYAGEGSRNVTMLVFWGNKPTRLERYAEDPPEPAKTAAGSTVAVPITVEKQLWGVLVVSRKGEQPLAREAEKRLENFTDLAGTAIANAKAREDLRLVADEQAALRRVATLVARGVAPSVVFAAVAEEVGKTFPRAELALVGRYSADRAIEYVGGWSSGGGAGWVGEVRPLGGQNVSTAVFESGKPARIDYLDDDATPVTALARSNGARSSAGAPIVVDGQLWGMVTVASVNSASLPHGTEHELAAFTELVATAIANTQAREELAASRARIVAAADEERRRIERDLHDGVQQRLVVLGLQLQALADAGNGATVWREQLTQINQGLASVLEDLRQISSGIHPAILRHGGLRAALRALARRSAIPVDLELPADLSAPDAVEVAAYYVASEALTNVVKHAEASSVEIRGRIREGQLELEIEDDGRGGATVGAGSGLIGSIDRVEAIGGRLEIHSPRGGGTTLRVTLPCDPPRASELRAELAAERED